MNRESFTARMTDILSFYAKPRNEAEGDAQKQYLTALYYSLQHIPESVWEGVCQEVVKTLSPIKKPVPAQFLAVYESRVHKTGASHATRSLPMTPDEHVSWCLVEIGKLTPEGARRALRVTGVQFSPPVRAALEARSAEEAEEAVDEQGIPYFE